MKTETKANLIFLFTQGLSIITFKTFITERNKLLKSVYTISANLLLFVFLTLLVAFCINLLFPLD
jgi:hypothetical protein